MSEKAYQPSADFLKNLMSRTEVIGDTAEGREIIARLIEMTSDPNPANRDWATMLLWQQDIDTPEVREALLEAAEDENPAVRAEAMRGLAGLDTTLALPFIRRELASEYVSAPVLEAAAIVADASLVDDLKAFTASSGNEYIDRLAREALAKCQAAM